MCHVLVSCTDFEAILMPFSVVRMASKLSQETST